MIDRIKTVRYMLFCGAIAAAAASLPAVGQVNFSIDIGTPPPPPRVVTAPPPRPGFVWVPGYWRWDGRRHVWTDGHWVAARPGYRYVPERWAEHDRRWRFEPGRWEREAREDDRRFDRDRHERHEEHR